jgi:hemerythrin
MTKWRDDLRIGISEIDIQHKMLFDNFDAFLAACAGNAEADGTYRLFWFLEAYAMAHFMDEEDLMQRVEFPDLEKHRAQHRAFTAEVGKFKVRLKAEGATESLVATMTGFIGGWLIKHVSTMDKAIGTYLASAGISATF